MIVYLEDIIPTVSDRLICNEGAGGVGLVPHKAAGFLGKNGEGGVFDDEAFGSCCLPHAMMGVLGLVWGVTIG